MGVAVPNEPKRFKEMMRRAGRDRTASKVVVSILRADSRAAQALERALSKADLSLPQFNVLMVLAASPDAGLPIFEVNAALVSTPPNTSWLTTRMEERGLITKSRSPEDRRVVLLELTEDGWRALAAAAPLAFDAERVLLEGFSRSEMKMFAELLGRFLD